MDYKLFFKPANQGLLALVIIATTVTAGIAVYGVANFGKISNAATEEITEIDPAPSKITALGRLEPATEIIKLSAPLSLDGDRIAKILFQEGDTVKTGEIIAILYSHNKLEQTVLQAEKEVRVAKARLAQIQAGAKLGDIQAQKANLERIKAQYEGDKNAQQENIARIEAQWQGDRIAQQATINKLNAQLNNAKSEYARYQKLYKEGAISNSLIDGKKLDLETAQQQLSEAEAVFNRINTTASKQLAEAKVGLNRIQKTSQKQINQAQGTLNSIAEVRPVDVKLAETEVDSAIARLNSAKTDLEAAFIRAPITGQILKIHSHVGEKISESGIADFAQTQQMLAVAEVYQTDISKVKIGQIATITSPTFSGDLKGKVTQIGLQVNRQNVFSNQPGENLDSRVIEVKIKLNTEDSQKVAGLTNLQVDTIIEL
ncbi:MAG: ABC exporter membrane fusion protein [Sphaerospermopsis sp. SIO1G2]|nr:ABC exporter membrane fusion protein [Sphaerospermopsis sp. SIO1G2]